MMDNSEKMLKDPSDTGSPRKRRARSMSVSRLAFGALVIVVLLIGFAIGFLAGFLSHTPSRSQDEEKGGGGLGEERTCPPQVPDKVIEDRYEKLSSELMEEQKASNIRKYLRDITKTPNLAGTEYDFSSAEKLKQFWDDLGFDNTKVIPYDVLLSYPDSKKPNRVELYDRRDNLIFTSKLEEPWLGPGNNASRNIVPPFNAYSAFGNPKGELVYVNYGRVEDFQWLLDEGIDVNGKICIARCGQIFRGTKAKIVQEYGGVGLILYTDPADYGPPTNASTFPHSLWMPPGGVQRGGLNAEGDPLTPGYPAIDSAFRVPETQADLPKIPVHPISYGDATELLKRIKGSEAPVGWRGKLPITYRLGPGFSEQNMKVQLKVFTRNEIATTYNVIGIIKGSVEPDRYVLMSNHRDAWVYGAVDPASGTAVLMEQSRALAEQMKTGWKPRRSIIFCSWGAEEYGLIGSTEWVEQYRQILGDRAVGLVNIDIAVSGNFTFRGKGMPLTYQLMYDVAKKVPNPDSDERDKGRMTLYDTWTERFPLKDENGKNMDKPSVPELGYGSDYAPFVSTVGVTSIDIRYMYDPDDKWSAHSLYHTQYETFHLVEHFMDPSFEFHLAVSRFGLEYALRLSESPIIPYGVLDYAKTVQRYVRHIESKHGEELDRREMSKELNHLNEAASRFLEESEEFSSRLDTINHNNILALRQANDQILNLERAFIDPQGIPGRRLHRHIIYAPSQHQSEHKFFPGFSDTLYEAERSTLNSADKWNQVRKHLSVMAFFIDAATSVLKPETGF